MQNHFDDHSMDEHCSYRDCRNNEMLPIGSEPSVDISTQLIKEKIHRIHCMQLERATHGRLTWQGDKIVSTTMRLRERECAVAAIRKQIDKLEAIGGLSSIVPSEGIVFKYKGKTYKKRNLRL